MKAFEPIKAPLMPSQLEPLELLGAASVELAQGTVCDVVLQKLELHSFELDQVRFERVEVSSARVKNTYMSNVLLDDCLFFGSHFDHARLVRSQIQRGIYSGVVLSGSTIEDVVFSACKLNMVNFRTATLKHVAFVDCDMTEADFGGARFDQVRFSGCKLSGAEFSGCQIVQADFRSSDISGIRGLGGLRRSTVSSAQIIDLSQAMAAEFGILIED